MNPAAGFQVPDFESSFNVLLNVPRADCSVMRRQNYQGRIRRIHRRQRDKQTSQVFLIKEKII